MAASPYHITIALVHITGVLAYQYTGIFWFLVLPAAQAIFSIFLFTIVAAFILSKPMDYEYQPELGNLGIRAINQIATLVTAYQLVLAGYSFLAGAIFVTATALLVMLYYIKIQHRGD
jgi:hypothetical protein